MALEDGAGPPPASREPVAWWLGSVMSRKISPEVPAFCLTRTSLPAFLGLAPLQYQSTGWAGGHRKTGETGDARPRAHVDFKNNHDLEVES